MDYFCLIHCECEWRQGTNNDEIVEKQRKQWSANLKGNERQAEREK